MPTICDFQILVQLHLKLQMILSHVWLLLWINRQSEPFTAPMTSLTQKRAAGGGIVRRPTNPIGGRRTQTGTRGADHRWQTGLRSVRNASERVLRAAVTRETRTLTERHKRSPPTAATGQHHTFPLLLHLFGALGGPASLLLLLLFLAAAVEVLHHHADEHVEHEEADQQQEGDEVDQTPLGVVLDRLAKHKTGRYSQSELSFL